MERQGVLALAVVPIINSGDWWGWVGFDDRATDRVWSAAEIEALKSAPWLRPCVIRPLC
jgi:GAF domain-containing protein